MGGINNNTVWSAFEPRAESGRIHQSVGLETGVCPTRLHINSAWAGDRACAGLNLRGPSWKVDVVKDRRRTNKRPKKTASREPRTEGRTENKKRQVKREKTSGVKTFWSLITSREFVRQFKWTEGKWSWWAAYSAVATSSTADLLLVNIRLEWNLVNEQ